jgi:hypothetical protein
MPRAAKTKPPGPAFLTQCACFACRKAFKKDLADPCYQPGCPECSGPLRDMGRYFRAPRKADTQQWRKVEMLAQAGVYFRTHEMGRMPETLLEAREFIAAQHENLARGARAREQSRLAAVAEAEKIASKRAKARQALKKRKASSPKLQGS